MGWNDEKNMTLTFDVTNNEEAVAFFKRHIDENIEREETFKQRIKQLFDEEISIEQGVTDDMRNRVLQVFALGYQHGWNDRCSVQKIN